MAVYLWSKTATNNATSSPSINWRNNQAPSTVKTNGRTTMAEIAEWRDDLAGMIDTAGTATALTVSTSQGLSSLVGADGFRVAARMHLRSGLAPTLNVDGTGAKNITAETGVTLDYGQLPKGSVQEFVYDEGDDEWRLIGTLPGWHVGEIRDTSRGSAPSGWLLCSGRTIGSASSNATARANADTEYLYTVLWTDYTDAELPMVTSGGSPTTRGASAAADFAANKRLSLPDFRGRVLAGKDDMGGTSANRLTNQSGGLNGDTLGASGGAETHTLTTAQTPAHTHTFDAGAHAHSWSHAGHTHTFAGSAHTHTFDAGSHTHTFNAGSHTHTFNAGSHSHAFTSNSHTHSFSATTGSSGAHTHTFSDTTSSSGSHAHFQYNDFEYSSGTSQPVTNSLYPTYYYVSGSGSTNYIMQGTSNAATLGLTSSGGAHTHTISGTTSSSGSHTHTVSGTTGGNTVSGTTDTTAVSGTTGSASVSGTTGSASVSGTTSSTTPTGTNSSTALSGTTGSASVSGDTGSTGGGEAHNNVQPTWIVNKMIKL
jgi:microcystin-dependent protein